MSIIHGLSHKVLKHFRAEPSSLAVYWIYCSRVNNEGVAFPSLRGLVRDTGWSVNQVSDARRWLVSVDALNPVKDYVRPAWKKLSKQELTRKRNFDRSEYFRVTGHIILDGEEHPLLYIPQKEASDIEDDESSHVSRRPTSDGNGRQTAVDVKPDATELDSLSELGTPLELGTQQQQEAVVVEERPKIYTLYEQNFGALTPMIGEALKDLAAEFAEDWIRDAFRIAVESEKRKLSYVRGILDNWKTNGRVAQKPKAAAQPAPKPEHPDRLDFDPQTLHSGAPTINPNAPIFRPRAWTGEE